MLPCLNRFHGHENEGFFCFCTRSVVTFCNVESCPVIFPLHPCAVETKIETFAMSARECLARIFEAGFSSQDCDFTHTGVTSFERRILWSALYLRDATNCARRVSLHFLLTLFLVNAKCCIWLSQCPPCLQLGAYT